MTSIQAIGTSTAVFNTAEGNQKQYKTLKLASAATDDSPIELTHEGHRYFKQTLEKNGKKEIMYVCVDEDPTELSETEAKKYTTEKTCEDGKDDGKISWWEKLKSMGKGIVKPFKSMFSSAKKAAITIGIAAAVIGACFIPVVGPFISAGLLYGGLALGVGTMGVGAYQSFNAKTDAEEKNAWENIGNGLFTTVTSLIGLKSFKGNLAQQATAVENATGQAAGTVNHISKAAEVSKGADDTIKAVGALSKVGSAAKSLVAAPVKTVFAPITEFKEMPNVFKTINALNHSKAGLAAAGISSTFKTVDLGLKTSEANMTHLEMMNGYFNQALTVKKNVAEAHTWLHYMKNLLPHIQGDEATLTQARAILDTAQKTMNGITVATGTKTAATAGVAAVTLGGANMAETPETEKLQAYTFVS